MSPVNIIKLSAIPSTNTYLKDLAKTCFLKDYTVVVTTRQTNGRGQLEAQWQSQANNSLTLSVFKRFDTVQVSQQWYVSMAVSMAVSEMLKTFKIPEISIKWPNDIMSRGKKCCGILIENTVKGTSLDTAIIGIGLNVNENQFTGLPNATSMRLLSGSSFDISEVFGKLLEHLQKHLSRLENREYKAIYNAYNHQLFRLDAVAVFSTKGGSPFNAILRGVTKEGLLLLENEAGQTDTYHLKEIKYCF
ncbi:MAG: BirA family biotin operon repressor/biotin-[acetyl-CoA-carboxylase] ligase [Patiriisocius sp.]